MIFEKIRTVISEQLGISDDKITPETSLIDDIGADSLDIFQIISELEEEFNIEFSAEEVEKMRTVSDTVEYIKVNAGN